MDSAVHPDCEDKYTYSHGEDVAECITETHGALLPITMATLATSAAIRLGR